MQILQAPIDTSDFSPADWKRLTDYVAVLIDIDQQNRKKNQSAYKKETS